jgi:hypothetical protein
MSIHNREAAVRSRSDPAIAGAMREFAFSDVDFRSLAQLAYDNAGIVLPESKRHMVYGRLTRRLRALELKTFRDYRNYLAKHGRAGALYQFARPITPSSSASLIISIIYVTSCHTIRASRCESDMRQAASGPRVARW